MARSKAKQLDLSFEQETPSGTINGSNKTFLLPHVPYSPKSVLLMLDSTVLKYTTHFTISGATITMVTAPQLGQDLFAWYFRRNT